MFSLHDVPGQDANETFDGYPVIRTFLNPQLMPLSKIPAFSGILRILTNYLFEDIKQACIGLLRSAVPDDLKLWQGAALFYATKFLPMIQEHNLIYLLPQALYSLCFYLASEVLAKLKDRQDILAKFLEGRSKLSGSFTKFGKNTFGSKSSMIGFVVRMTGRESSYAPCKEAQAGPLGEIHITQSAR
ncbi:hypothetical protein M422DRAFT_251618 [Sphaerobolus stellatus SS14]|uniref:Uncharacterized protein n=1 Tax=Sphaerobolus stellatus (strain SS14) TaxID=990650 RepID=A0A0C9VRG9_SPHS4|nr:hypothetical protein M422DRAFT_251618 [Sphaerobolus stellatus SS14]